MPVDIDPGREMRDRTGERALQPLPHGVAPGARVTLRGQTWRLAGYEPHDDCGELRLQPHARPGALVLLWPFDRPCVERTEGRWRIVRPRRWLRSVAAIAARDCRTPHLTARAAAAAILPYQLAPALSIAAGESRILLADEVGLGKTAQAGWIVSDLLERRPDCRVLVAVPAGVRIQWTRELKRLFWIESRSVDARWLLNEVNALPPGITPWTPPGVYVASADFIKRPDVAASMNGHSWDLLIVDEAHTAAAPTERYQALEALARRSRCVVLITATPFSGDDAGFASLLALGGSGAAPLMFRRSRQDVGDGRLRRHHFARVRVTSAEHRLQRLLHRYCREIWVNAPAADARLAAIVLRKRALSSPSALARSLRRRQRLLETADSVPLQLALFADDVDGGDDEPGAVLGAPGMADTAREQRWLAALTEAAARAGATDSKRRFLSRFLRRVPEESALVFTEFRDTLADLAAGYPSALRLHGGLTPAERAQVQDRFNREGGLLFATDAAAHGLNLHEQCRLVVNFELPWNPARLEQRIGRVDRIGQRRVVHASTLVARDTAEDLVIANLVRRLTGIARTLGADDRLTAFLNDARTAGIVFDGSKAEAGIVVETNSPTAGPVSRLAAFSATEAAAEEARRLERATELGRYAESREPRLSPAAGVEQVERNFSCALTSGSGADVIVTSVPESASLRAGFITVLQWTLRQPAGSIVACRTIVLHTAAALRKPAAAAEARLLARRFVAACGAELCARVVPLTRDDCTVSANAHAEWQQASMAREHDMRGALAAPAAVQPGLFDDRAVRDAAATAERRAEWQRETAERLAVLAAASPLQERVDVCAVLLAWSRTA